VSNPSFDSACVVDSVMQDEVRTNQRQPKILFVILVHSGTNYLSTKFGFFELILFHTLSEQLSLERDVSDIMCVNATLNDY